MLIPVRCFSCGKIMSDKWFDYVSLCDKYRNPEIQTVELLDSDSLKSTDETAEYKALKELKIKRMCCRRHFLCNVDLVDII